MQGALEEVSGVEDILVTFDRREAVVRYDTAETNIRELEDAVAATGGYKAGLKYGPVPAADELAVIAERPEYPLVDSNKEFDYTGVFILSRRQVDRMSHHLADSVGSALLRNIAENDLVAFVSLWTDTGANLLIDWRTAAQFVPNSGEPVLPTTWIPLAGHIEGNGGGSIAGLLVYTNLPIESTAGKLRLNDIGGNHMFETAQMSRVPE